MVLSPSSYLEQGGFFFFLSMHDTAVRSHGGESGNQELKTRIGFFIFIYSPPHYLCP